MKNFTFLSAIALTAIFSNAYAVQTLNSSPECLECHGELKNVVVHKAAAISCFLCHTDHDTPTNFPHRVKKPVNQLCATCHKDKNMLHVSKGHPLVGKDPLHPETNDWNCVSCHNPHQSKSANLFRYDYNRKTTPYQGVACYVCHDEDTWKRQKLDVPAWNGYGEVE